MANVTLVEICRKYVDENSRHVLPKKEKITVGKGKNCDIVIVPSVMTQGVSRNHCTIIREGNNLRVFDNGSLNGTFVDDKKVSPEGENLYDKSYLYLYNYPLQVEISLYDRIKSTIGGLFG